MSDTPLSVSDAMNAAKRALEGVRVTVVGEVSEFNDKPGYKAAYFTVSDGKAAMPCLMWRNQYQYSGVTLRAGLLVEMRGYFSAYVPKGRMQFSVESLRLAGEGDLRVKVAQLAQKLEAEGLMASSRKREIPQMPKRIAVVTSPRGKAIHDVMRTLRRRYPIAELLIAGVTVEGEAAPAAIVEGLRVAQDANPDVILLVRGGGSYEDLMPFNSEEVARAVAASEVPVVSGIGHEPDTTIADMVSDLRASTPTAAAEAATPSLSELSSQLVAVERSLGRALERHVAVNRHYMDRLASRPVFSDPQVLLGAYMQTLDLAESSLRGAIPRRLENDRVRLSYMKQRLAGLGARIATPYKNEIGVAAARLHDLSPLAILGRGYAITYNKSDGHVVRSVDQIEVGDSVSVRVADGSIDAIVSASAKESVVELKET